MRIIVGSLNPQQVTAVATTSLGLSTMMQYIPTVLGFVATVVGIIASVIISLKNRQEKKNNTEKHEEWRKKSQEESIKRNMEMELLRRKLENDERD